MSLTPTALDVEYPGLKPFLPSPAARRKSVTLSAITRDTGSTPVTLIRRGLVIALITAGTKWVDADDATANANTVASITSSIDVDGTWATETILITLNGGHQVTFAIVGSTAAALKIELDAVAVFAGNYTATVVGSAIRIDSLATGDDQLLHCQITTIAGFGVAGVGVDDFGAFGEFGITEEVVDMVGLAGADRDVNVTMVYADAGVFTDRITSLTTAAKRALLHKGYIFE